MREFKLVYFSLYITWRDIKKNFLFILLAVWIGFSASRLYCTYFEAPSYSSSMIVAVNVSGYSANTTTGTVSNSISVASVVHNVFRSDMLKKVIAEKTGKPVAASVEATQMSDTNFVLVRCKALDPHTAYDSLIQIKDGYRTLTDTVFGNLTLSMVRSPSVSVEKANRRADFILEIEYSLICGALAVFLMVILSYFRDTVKNESDIENLLDSELFETVYAERTKKNDKTPLMISEHNTGYLFNYSFNKMAIKLESLKRTRDITSILITSVFENEGKTTVAANLAISLASEGNKVVLVDTDFKNPSVRKMFPGVDDKGKNLVEYLKDEASIEDVTVHDKSKVDIICNFKTQRKSTEYLRNERFINLLGELEKKYDFVIIDSPPVGLVSDTEILKEYVSSVLFVIAQDYSEVGAIVDAMENFDEEKILGCVFNRVGQFKRLIKDKLQLDS